MPRRITLSEVEALENENAYLKGLIKTKFKDFDIKLKEQRDDAGRDLIIEKFQLKLQQMEVSLSTLDYLKVSGADDTINTLANISYNDAQVLSTSPRMLDTLMAMLLHPNIKEQIINITLEK